MPVASVNPASGELLRSFESLPPEELEQKLALAARAFRQHRQTSFAERAKWLQNTAQILETEAALHGRLIALEMGKTLASAIAEVSKCAAVCRYYAENGAAFLADELTSDTPLKSFVRYQPLGPVLAVMPWNFPFWQVFRFAAPALMAGNVGLLKHASNVPQCALAIEDILRRAGFAPGTFQTLLVEAPAVEPLLQDDRIVAATLTGSEPAGRAIARVAGQQIKKTVLELGGSDAFIVMPSADLDRALIEGVRARIICNGQSCIAAKRFIVATEVYDEFERRFVERMSQLRVGDPMTADTELGPLATAKRREDLHAQVDRAHAAGARILTGGWKLDGFGYYYAPTVLTSIARDNPVFHEELFGPVAMLFRARDAAEAIEIANDSPFGLGCSVWTRDSQEAARFIDDIDAGQVFVNATVASDPQMPFGGIKRSGYGRELGRPGIREFVNEKTIASGDDTRLR